MRRIGIDVGGTHTDAVLVADGDVRAAVKTPTTDDVTEGIARALAELMSQPDGAARDIDAVMIGTTHFTNAVVQRRGLERVGAVRVGLPSGRTLPPLVDWPAGLADAVRGVVAMVEGGHEYDGRPLVPFDRAGMREAAQRLRDVGVEAVAISAVFSPLTPEAELEAAAVLREVLPGARVTLSHTLGRIGLLERENAAILNAALSGLARRTVDAFAAALRGRGIEARLYLTQNDGTVMGADFARDHPVHSFASGPTNSMRGAAFLSGLADAIVVDAGGTTTDVGHLRAGFPREANAAVEVGGVRTLFRMPDLLSLGLGGGSVVSTEAGTVGPVSVGHRLAREARIFGGPTLTATDLAVAAGRLELGDPAGLAGLDEGVAEALLGGCHAAVAEAVDRMKIDPTPLPLVAVGGAAFLVPESLPGISEVVRVPHHAVANAVGAAIAQVSGEVDRVFQGVGRDEAVAQATREAHERARAAGADPAAMDVVEVEDLPLAYVPGGARRVRVRVVGDAGGSGG